MENKSARDRAEEIVSKLKHQARVLGSSGKGYGDFARVNREAARMIQELLEVAEPKDQMIDCYHQERDKMAVCDHCTYRYSWDCDDGLPYPPKGCENFKLDFETLTKRQQKAIRRILAREEDE